MDYKKEGAVYYWCQRRKMDKGKYQVAAKEKDWKFEYRIVKVRKMVSSNNRSWKIPVRPGSMLAGVT